MKEKILQQIVDTFLKEYGVTDKPVLLAFSGGPDSLALLHLLLEYRRRNPFILALAHVDHGWRPESSQEAEMNAQMAQKLGLPFHLKTLAQESLKGNLEAVCREERLRFFASLCVTHGYQGVLLAHHADDLAETTLKRTLEGAALPFLGGLKSESEWQGLKLWRPLLAVTKESLKNWLAVRNLHGFYDKTNEDKRFLRGKLRTSILPLLSEEFGKQVHQGLWRIGMEAIELRDYLDARIAPFQAQMVSGILGTFLDLSKECPKALLELKHLVRRGCERHNFTLSHVHVNTVAHLLAQKVPDKCVIMGTKKIYIDRGRLFICAQDFLPLAEQKIKLQVGQTVSLGSWIVEVNRFPSSAALCSTDWHRLWHDEGQAILPDGDYELALPQLTMPYPRSQSLSKWWTDHKVPAFMRSHVPIIWDKSRVCHEFLTGKMSLSNDFEQEKLLIKLKVSKNL